MRRKTTILIAGGGVVGLTLAALLASSKQASAINLLLVDGSPAIDFRADEGVGLRVSAISSGSTRILRSAGGWTESILDRVCAYSEMRVWDASRGVEGPDTLRFSADEFALPQLGFIVGNKLLQFNLLDSLNRYGQKVEFSTHIRALDEEGDKKVVRLSSGQIVEPDLIVGADGAASFVRKQAAIGTHRWRYNQTAFVTHLRTQNPHRNTAWQRFLVEGPVALLPLHDGRVSLVWTTTEQQAKAAIDMPVDALSDVLTTATDGVLGKLVPDGPRGSFPLAAQYTKQYVLPKLALIGDAAHSVHPLAGQGANLGIADAASLAEVVLAAISAGEYIGDYRVLRRYERQRKGSNLTMLQFIDGLNRLFRVRSPAIRTVRTTGMRMFNRSGILRTKAIRVALGIDDRPA